MSNFFLRLTNDIRISVCRRALVIRLSLVHEWEVARLGWEAVSHVAKGGQQAGLAQVAKESHRRVGTFGKVKALCS